MTLIGPFDLSYEEAAVICTCAIGTVNSRVSRARVELRQILNQADLHVGRGEVDPVSKESSDAFLDLQEWLVKATISRPPI
jgi:RNA polymerase sigma-70 factor (ECF subfamily)